MCSSSAPASSTNGLSGLLCPLVPTPCFLASPRYLLGPISVPLPWFRPHLFQPRSIQPCSLLTAFARAIPAAGNAVYSVLLANSSLSRHGAFPDPPSSRACAFPRSVHVRHLKSDLLKARHLVRFPSHRELLGCRDLDASPLSSSVPRMVGVY